MSGKDASLFVIDNSSGELSFANSPDWASPNDNDGNNIYEITISASTVGVSAEQKLNVYIYPESNSIGNDWVELGQSLLGAEGDNFGIDAVISEDGKTVAVGAHNNSDGGEWAGQVKVFRLIEEEWQQIGQDLNGDTPYQWFGYRLSISANGNRIAIWRPGLLTNSQDRVEVYEYIEQNWLQIGEDIVGDNFGDRFGFDIDMNSDGSIVAIGADRSSVNGRWSGEIKIFHFSREGWFQMGESIIGEAEQDGLGHNISLSSSGFSIVAGASVNEFNGENSGFVGVYDFNGDIWVQKGELIRGEEFMAFGNSVDINSRGDVVAFGAQGIYPNGETGGIVKVYEFDGGAWNQNNENILGEYFDDGFGDELSISNDGKVLAVGALGNDDNGERAGHVRIYRHDGNEWVQIGTDLDGDFAGDSFSNQLELNAEGSKLVVAAWGSDENGQGSGKVKVFELNAMPTVAELEVIGDLSVAVDVTATYAFIDLDLDEELGTVYQWYISDNDEGTNKVAIADASSEIYTIQENDLGKYLSVLVTPNDGKSQGVSVESAYVGPIKTGQSITFDVITSKTYGDPNFALSATSDSGLEVAFSSSNTSVATISENEVTIVGAGSTDITASQLGNEQFASAEVSQTLTVTQAALTATAMDKSKTYGDANPEFTITYDGFVNGDDVTSITEPMAETIANATSDVGDYDITLTGGSASNYIITNTNGTLTINERPITITADVKSKVYGEDDPAFTYQITSGSLVNSDEINGELARTAGEDVGDYAINQNTLIAGSNYDLTYYSDNLTINKATLTVTADDKSKVYGEANPDLTITYAGFVNGEDKTAITEPTVSTTATASTGVGTVPITLAGGSSTNYNITNNNGMLSISKADLSASVQDEIINKGDDLPTFKIDYIGFVNGEDETVLTTAPTASTSATSMSDRGTYAIELSDGSADNYEVNTTNGTLTVTGPVYTLPSSISFSEPLVLGDSDSETITIANTGDGELEVTGIAIPAGYSIDQTNFNVSTSASTILTLTFTPTAAQTYAGDITITSNNGDDVIAVTGEGQIVTGVDDESLDLSEVKIYPNPSDKWLTIDLSGSPANQADFILIDSKGEAVWQKQEVKDRVIKLSTIIFPTGFYLLIVETDKGTIVKKVMVQH